MYFVLRSAQCTIVNILLFTTCRMDQTFGLSNNTLSNNDNRYLFSLSLFYLITFWSLLLLSIFENIFGDLSKIIEYFVFQNIPGKIQGKSGESPGKSAKIRGNSGEIPEKFGIFENCLHLPNFLWLQQYWTIGILFAIFIGDLSEIIAIILTIMVIVI